MKVQDLFETADPELAWFIVRVSDDKIGAGPYSTRNNAFAAKQTKQWYNPTDYDVAYGWVDEDDVFHDAPIKEGVMSKQYQFTVRTGRVKHTLVHSEKALAGLSPHFMTSAEKKQALKLEVGDGFAFTAGDASVNVVRLQ